VELLEEKLRKYFLYWLDVCSRRMENEVSFDGNVIVVIEGIDSFNEPEFHQFKEAHLKFWLPKTLPNRIRFIVTADAKSLANKYLHRIGCEKIKIKSEKKVISHVIEKYENRDSFVSDEHKKKVFEIIIKKQEQEGSDQTINTIFTKSFLSVYCPYPNEIVAKGKVTVEETMVLFQGLDYNKLEGTLWFYLTLFLAGQRSRTFTSF
jgi:hypothetical protein